MQTLDWAFDLLSTFVAATTGLSMLVFGAVLIGRWYKMQHFHQTQGRVLHVRLRENWHEEGDYAVEVTYEYSVGRRIFKRRSEDDNRIEKLHSHAAALRVKRKLEQQQKIPVRYDPDRPEVAVGIEPPLKAIHVALGMIVSGTILLMVAAHIQGLVDLEPYVRPLTSLFPS